MNQLGGFPLLTLIVFLPVLGAAITLVISFRRREALYWMAFLIAVTGLFVSLFLYMGWADDPEGSMQFVDGPSSWITSLGIHYYFGVDGISLHLVLLTTLLTALVILFTWQRDDQIIEKDQSPNRIRARTFWILIFEAGILGGLTALNLALFSLFWLVTLLSTFFMVGANTSRSQVPPGFIIAMAIAAAAMLGAIAGLGVLQSSLNLPDLIANALPWQAQAWLFWALTLAFGLTSGVFFLHFGCTQAFCQAPPAARLLIGCLLLNLGGYGLLRFCLPLFPLATVSFAPTLVTLGTVGVLYGAFAALGQKDAHSTLAYWNVSQMSLATVGIFSLQNLGVHGTVMQMVGRSLSTAALLLLLDARTDQEKTQTGQPAVPRGDRFALTLGFLSAIGVPGLIGFVGQGTLVLGILRWRWQVSASPTLNRAWDWVLVAFIVLGLVVGAWALLRAWRRVRPLHRFSRQATIALPVLFLIVLAGLYPSRVSDTIGPSVNRLLIQVDLGAQRALRQMAPPASPEENEVPSSTATSTPDQDARTLIIGQEIVATIQRIQDVAIALKRQDWQLASATCPRLGRGASVP
jgi:NADH-quinone oxidoreductase subunit M